MRLGPKKFKSCGSAEMSELSGVRVVCEDEVKMFEMGEVTMDEHDGLDSMVKCEIGDRGKGDKKDERVGEVYGVKSGEMGEVTMGVKSGERSKDE